MKRRILAYLMYGALVTSAHAVVDINNASQGELETLNGIGPAKAQAIIEYRKKSGGFKSVEELDQVPGIGQATLEHLKKDITVSSKKAAPGDPLKTDKTPEKRK